ncbi:hypothetical protein GCM10011338_12950 [Alteromonas lipolytica]|nr:hypothetical protein GCM10011338_12950 [Alteromonas lipolytica]
MNIVQNSTKHEISPEDCLMVQGGTYGPWCYQEVQLCAKAMSEQKAEQAEKPREPL